jgi:long-chain acyl-CoA synthetase
MAHTLYALVTRNMERIYPQRAAFRWYDEASGTVCTRTYAQYAQDIRRAVRCFAQSIPEMQGKRVCILSRNCYEYGVNALGVMLAGGVLAPLNQRADWGELQAQLELAQPAAILSDGVDYGCAEQLQAAYGSLLRPMDGYTAFDPTDLDPHCIDPDGLLMLAFTSGTTGRSKAVMLSERNFFTSMAAFTDMVDTVRTLRQDPAPELSMLAMLPMFHIGTFACFFSWPVAGWTMNLVGDLRNFYREMERMPSDYMLMVPMVLQAVLKDLRAGRRERLGKLQVVCCSSAMFRPEDLAELASYGILVMQIYASTETCACGLFNAAQDTEHIGAVGRACFGTQYRIAPDGELCIRGDMVTKGYYKDPTATAEVLDADGWFHTGDLARTDKEGYYYITGRKKNLIILDSGENVSPEELEKLLSGCTAVQECLVQEKGQKICAQIFCPQADQAAVRDFVTQLNRTLPMYKRITALVFRDEPLPRNAAGKLDRQAPAL